MLTIEFTRFQCLRDVYLPAPDQVVRPGLLRVACDLELPRLIGHRFEDGEAQLFIPDGVLPSSHVDLRLLGSLVQSRLGVHILLVDGVLVAEVAGFEDDDDKRPNFLAHAQIWSLSLQSADHDPCMKRRDDQHSRHSLRDVCTDWRLFARSLLDGTERKCGAVSRWQAWWGER